MVHSVTFSAVVSVPYTGDGNAGEGPANDARGDCNNGDGNAGDGSANDVGDECYTDGGNAGYGTVNGGANRGSGIASTIHASFEATRDGH